jgi:hypothetical protein
MTTFSPLAPTVNGTRITVDYLVKNPVLVQRILRSLVNKRLIGARMLTGRVDVTGTGAAIFETGESIFANDVAEVIDELAEYPLTDTSDVALSVFTVDKYGLATDIPDAVIQRNRMDVVARKLVKIANRIVFGFDTRCLSVIASGVTATSPASALWSAAGADPLLDTLLAAAAVDGLDEGFEVNTIALKPVPWARLVANAKILNMQPREGGDNPVVTGKMIAFAGLEIYKTNAMPAGVDVMLVDRLQLGSIMYEDQGGGYQGDAGDVDGVQSKLFRLDKQDGVRLQVRKLQEPVLQEPGAGIKLTGV